MAAAHHTSAFSPSMTLAGMDYIAPSAVCILPTLTTRSAAEAPSTSSGAVGVKRGGNAEVPNQGGRADVVRITLQDCLACSGCVTTAETVLVNAQSRREIVTALLSADGAARPRLVSISSQSCASLAAYLGIPMSAVYELVAGFMRATLTTPRLRELAAEAELSQAEDAATEAPPPTPIVNEESHAPTGAAAAAEPPVYVVDLAWAEQLSAALTAEEYARRRRGGGGGGGPDVGALPMIVSACPGWVCYCEKQGAALLPHLCPVMSAQGIAGSYAKRAVAADMYHVSIQPCFDRKLEAARDSMPSPPSASTAAVFYTDCVLSTAELLEWMTEVDAALPWRGTLDTDTGADVKADEEAPPRNAAVSASCLDAARLAGSGGYHQSVMAHRLRAVQAAATASPIAYEVKRNRNHQLATCAALPGEVFCVGYGFQQIQNVVRGLKKRLPAMRGYTFVELMACPDGCLNGGGQVRPAQQPHAAVLDAVVAAYASGAPAVRESGGGGVQDSERVEGDDVDSVAPARRHRVELPSPPSQPFAPATVAAVAPLHGEALWRCTFRDREQEFAEMLNAGNVHSLKW
ncbi:hydrogenase [Novymonas esmeraldas]|uniref:Hydrogenase n=1 Tax=Novymonas esmeraldas TaxID=1808958 RepID=A0AAW0EWZ8_9TRYP